MALKFDDYFEENEEERQKDADMIELDKKREAKQKKEEEARARADEDIEENTFIIPNSHRRKKLWVRWSLFVAFVVVAFIVVRTMYFTPMVKEGQVRGYIVKMEKVGQFFDSYEGELVLDQNQELTDSLDVFDFSLTDEVLGEKLMSSMAKDSAVVVTYRRYGNAVPWRGNSEVEVFDAQMVKLISNKR